MQSSENIQDIREVLQQKKEELLLNNFNKYFEVGGESADVYGSMIYIIGTEKDDSEGALKMIKIHHYITSKK